MNINSKNIYITYLFLYFSLLLGFYFNEDFGLGYITDYSVLKLYVPLFEKNFATGPFPNTFPSFFSKFI